MAATQNNKNSQYNYVVLGNIISRVSHIKNIKYKKDFFDVENF